MFFLVIVFNLASWIDIGAISVELPLLVNRLPESWELPSYFATVVQGSKVSVVVFLILEHIYKDKIPEVGLIFLIISVGAGAIFCLGFVWQYTVSVGGVERSIPLLTLAGILGLVDTLSNVVFLPYMAHYKTQYMSAFFFGKGLTQIIPSLISMIQGIGEHPKCINHTKIIPNAFNDTSMTNASYTMIIPVYPEPKFSIGVFFIIISAIMVLSAVSFALLHYLPHCKRARVKEPTNSSKQPISENVPLKEKYKSPRDTEQTPDYEEVTNNTNLVSEHAQHVPLEKTPTKAANGAKAHDYAFVCLITGWVTALMFGFSFALLPFAALPYGNRAYSLAERLGKLSFALGALLTIFYSPRSYVLAGVMTLLATLCTVYLMFLASLSPFPPLATNAIGEILVVCILKFLIY